ncbi:conserved protein of unknown function [Pseudodesulfovibrio profundus]|uniref:Uncharacterized protein n=1 Tax=Pseudodesulfovibrio profundus TaxID=57320 RepID=A0A2C8FB07_9BACT|nr:hypothetical protein [Pseudodesulfovibrio profundus]SOB59734.1 conserved protein of unknown function [Pseudodesulfovibrio profundus]
MQNVLIYLAIIGIMLQAGCSVVQVQHEESSIAFGSSARLAMRQQILNPEAGGDAPVVGIDGRYAETVAEKYLKGPKTKSESGQSISEVIIGTR